jgi:drug/metabolite transporter (DMT)-like permease
MRQMRLTTVGHWLIILAYRKAAASTIAPFSYVQLLFAGLLGFGVFGTGPGAMTLVGGARYRSKRPLHGPS